MTKVEMELKAPFVQTKLDYFQERKTISDTTKYIYFFCPKSKEIILDLCTTYVLDLLLLFKMIFNYLNRLSSLEELNLNFRVTGDAPTTENSHLVDEGVSC